ncbi:MULTISPECIES: APC family permease [unclassified Streptomyces]|uniref:APC family permease n=1 Tax=unclassified Streptomyces TaxID=2593676 RepID=UPI000DB956DF|nr:MULTISPECIES: APC family permease [unclassified Streptomyces]MYT75410.1 amino acid permease [Streptomyces sp. SID8367]RAJ86812.1 amino acid transporter [Streptomyces sp. PsTaAH-137]
MHARTASAQDVDEGRRLSVLDLVGLAAGGVVGSGWLLAAGQAHWAAGEDAVWAWVIGGAVMLLIAAVMVELGIAAPKTGGLIFLPLQAAGPLVATVVAAALWIVYAVNPASEAAAMVRGLAHWFPSLLRSGHVGADVAGLPLGMDRANDLSLTGALCAVLLMIVVVGFNLLPARRLIRLNLFLTVIKVLVPLLIVVCLTFAATDTIGSCAPGDAWYLSGQSGGADQLRGQAGHFSALYVVLGGGIIYAYIGFQAPLDFAGNIKRRGMGEAARLRWAVYGTLVGAVALYTALQYVFARHCGALAADLLQSPYAQFATAASMSWLAWLIRLNAVLSPMGSGIVFTHALTREVAALSRAHLTHRGLQTARRASFKFRGAEIDAYWMILIVNLVIGLTTLALVRGNWEQLVALNSVPIMVVYAMPGVVLVALPGTDATGLRKAVRWCLAYAGFVAVAVVIHEAGWADVWRGMAGVGTGAALLLALPWLAVRDLPYIGRVLRHYDAREHVSRFTRRGDPAVPPLLLLVGYIGVLVGCTGLRALFGEHTAPLTRAVSVLAAVLVFPLLVRAARRYMDRVKPTLPHQGEAPRPRVSAET